MSVDLLALGLSIVSLLCVLGTVLLARRRAQLAYARGYAEAGAALFGVVAAELGYDAPVLDRMLARYGARAPDLH